MVLIYAMETWGRVLCAWRSPCVQLATFLCMFLKCNGKLYLLVVLEHWIFCTLIREADTILSSNSTLWYPATDVGEHIIGLFEEEGWSAGSISGWYGVPKSLARAWLQKCWMDGWAGRSWGARLRCVSSLAQHVMLVAKVERTSFNCVRELKAATNFAGFQCTVMSQLVSWAQHAVMKDLLIEEHKVYHLVFTENSVECQWVRGLFPDKSIFHSANVGLILVYGPQGERYNSEYISTSTCSGHVSEFLGLNLTLMG